MSEEALVRIAIALEAAIASSGKAPGWEYPIAECPTMDWEKLGIKVYSGSAQKPVVLEWMGHRYDLFESKTQLSYQRMVSESTSALLIRFYKNGNAPGTGTVPAP
jgi:hypothetical protein